mmetsp:Transcript_14685/g.32254  ORF Transcript_14685/g.32254 Transcript_14685/m.32254 type:complete len:403 (+) Transcript_14685:174-1382(+)
MLFILAFLAHGALIEAEAQGSARWDVPAVSFVQIYNRKNHLHRDADLVQQDEDATEQVMLPEEEDASEAAALAPVLAKSGRKMVGLLGSRPRRSPRQTNLHSLDAHRQKENFLACGLRRQKSWRSSRPCKGHAEHSNEDLCSWWMEAKCVTRWSSRCESVNTMCHSLDAHSWQYPALSGGTSSLVFLHIPKNAGTAIEDAGIAEGYKWGRHMFGGLVRMPDEDNPIYHKCIRYHVPPAYLPDARMYSGSETFCVTRHPYERAVSEYRYLLQVSWGNMLSPFLNEAPTCSKDGLNHFLQQELNNMKNGHRFALDCHMVPQHEYVWGPDGKQWCQELLRMDNLQESFNELMLRKGVPVRLGGERENNSGEHCSSLGTKDLDPDTKALLNEVYREDFDRLGYSPY